MAGRFFIGSALHKLDAKGRVSLPSDYRDVLREHGAADGFILVPAQGADFHLALSRTAHEALVQRLGSMDYASPKQRADTRRRFISNARPVSLEDGGRFVLSQGEREALDLGREVRFVGDAETFQIWEPARYQAIHGPDEAAEEAVADVDLAGLV